MLKVTQGWCHSSNISRLTEISDTLQVFLIIGGVRHTLYLVPGSALVCAALVCTAVVCTAVFILQLYVLQLYRYIQQLYVALELDGASPQRRSVRALSQIRGESHSRLLSSLSPTVRASHFDREKTSAPSSLVDSHRCAM